MDEDAPFDLHNIGGVGGMFGLDNLHCSVAVTVQYHGFLRYNMYVPRNALRLETNAQG